VAVSDGQARGDIWPSDFDIRLDEKRGICNLIVSIKNDGDVNIPKFRIRFYRGNPADNIDEAGNLHTGWHEAGPIEPGKTWGERTRDFHLPDGQYEFYVVLNYDSNVPETDKTNDRAVLKVKISNGQVVEKSVNVGWGLTHADSNSPKFQPLVRIDVTEKDLQNTFEFTKMPEGYGLKGIRYFSRLGPNRFKLTVFYEDGLPVEEIQAVDSEGKIRQSIEKAVGNNSAEGIFSFSADKLAGIVLGSREKISSSAAGHDIKLIAEQTKDSGFKWEFNIDRRSQLVHGYITVEDGKMTGYVGDTSDENLMHRAVLELQPIVERDGLRIIMRLLDFSNDGNRVSTMDKIIKAGKGIAIQKTSVFHDQGFLLFNEPLVLWKAQITRDEKPAMEIMYIVYLAEPNAPAGFTPPVDINDFLLKNRAGFKNESIQSNSHEQPPATSTQYATSFRPQFPPRCTEQILELKICDTIQGMLLLPAITC
jgi:hypothetical protein